MNYKILMGGDDMPANVDTMFYVGKMPWHKEGTHFDNPPETKEAIVAAGLNWEVYKARLYTFNGSQAEGYYGIVRSDTKKILGVVKDSYSLLQNYEAFDFFEPLITSEFLEYETAGAIGDGEIIWILAKVKCNSTFSVQKKDPVAKYLLLSNSHDGMSSLNIKFTPIRVVCQNTLNIALNKGETTKIKHLSNIVHELKDVQNAITGINFVYSRIEGVFNQMAETSLTTKKVNEYFNQIYPLHDERQIRNDSQRQQKNISRKIHTQLFDIFENGIGIQEFGLNGTLWAAYNAVTHHIDHPENYKLGDNRLLKRIWFGEGELIKERAYDAALKMLKAS